MQDEIIGLAKSSPVPLKVSDIARYLSKYPEREVRTEVLALVDEGVLFFNEHLQIVGEKR